MRLIANLSNQHQGCRLLAKRLRRAAIGKDQRFEAYLTMIAFGNAYQYIDTQAQFNKHLSGDLDLAFATINQHQTRHDCFAISNFAKTARQYLTHGRVVVTRRYASNVIAAIQRGLHRMVSEHHARGLGRLTGGVADVKALNVQRLKHHWIGVELKRLSQRERTGTASPSFR